MDIIDILLAKALTPQGKTDIYVGKANKAAAKAEQAKTDAETAVATVEAAASTIAETQESAETLLATAQETLETAQQAQLNIPDTEDIDAEVKKLVVNTNVVEGQNVNTVQVVSTYPDNTLNTQNVTKLYKSTGQNEDGTMTQKAITNALNEKADSSALNSYASKQYVDTQIANIPSGGSGSSGNMNGDITADDVGHLVVVNEDGSLTSSSATEEDLVNALLSANILVAKDAVGLDMDYANKNFTRIQEAVNLEMGTDFDQYIMYGGRTRCNVADNGEITAFYGDNNYAEDGSNGQVMVYQPKFYYKRTPYSTASIATGEAVRHESLILSSTRQAGFKLAPIFEEDLAYILLPAFDASVSNNKLASVAGVQPVTNITISEAESLANARGTGWHLMNMAAESANQMLEIVEFGSMNGQVALEAGITQNPNNGQACYFITGSTSNLGNTSGHAESTQVSINGNISTQSGVGYRAISYRGMENPWGNLWSMIGGINVYGTGGYGGGTPYICTDFNYTPGQIGNNYESVGFALPYQYKWISAMGRGNEKYDWVFLPVETAETATSLLPIGDSIWVTPGLNGVNIIATGGSYGYTEECGPFYYAADRNAGESARYNYGAKLLFIPTKNSVYTANIAKWNNHVGG